MMGEDASKQGLVDTCSEKAESSMNARHTVMRGFMHTGADDWLSMGREPRSLKSCC
jgi:hypothetical protein